MIAAALIGLTTGAIISSFSYRLGYRMGARAGFRAGARTHHALGRLRGWGG